MPPNSKLIIFTDGGARGNPGPAALGVVIYDEKNQLVKKFGRFLGEKTNNEAEYEALIAALEESANLGAKRLEINVDSELVVRQLYAIYKVKNERMQALVLRVRNLETKFDKVSYKNIPRGQNELADALVNEAIDKV